MSPGLSRKSISYLFHLPVFNQAEMVVAACNRVGEEAGSLFGGKSVILDAWGKALIEGGEDEMLLTAEVDLSHVTRVREKIPVFKDRRPDIYTY